MCAVHGCCLVFFRVLFRLDSTCSSSDRTQHSGIPGAREHFWTALAHLAHPFEHAEHPSIHAQLPASEVLVALDQIDEIALQGVGKYKDFEVRRRIRTHICWSF